MPEKTVAQKLLIKENQRLLVMNTPAEILDALDPLPGCVHLEVNGADAADAILLFAANRAELEQYLPAVKGRLALKGLLWVIYYKGTSRLKGDIHRDSINAFAHEIGLEGVAMISVNEELSALRLKVVG